ncbi:hypothetical protein FB451DRAFT_1409751 [Mycena latifolia]|nr:hypothetical protein FB451DRAFT_1409751 [Mycena latifolia]
MNPQDRVPNELWLEILQILPRYILKDVSFTCRTIRRLSRPFLFTDLYFSPYSTESKGVLLLPSESAVERCLERLNFWSSAEIAPFVRYCSISPWSSWTRKDLDLSPTDSPYILLDALFERLVCFTGLQRLHADGVHFTQASVETICRLPTLSELSVTRCSVAPGERIIPSPRTLRVSSFCIRPKVEVELEHGDDFWIPLLHPDHLHKLIAIFCPRLLGRAVHTIPSFPRVHELAATMNLPTSSENLFILSKFPAVQVLSIADKGPLSVGPGAPPRAHVSADFPFLRRYTGSYKTLPLFLPVATLTHLTTASCNSRDFITQMQAIQRPNSITTLHATFNSFNNTTLNALVSLFPQLIELRFDIVFPTEDDMFQGDFSEFPHLFKKDMLVDSMCGGDDIRVGFKPTKFFKALADSPTLPPTLERLSLSWECDERYTGVPSAYKLPDFGQLRDALAAKCPTLSWLRLDGYYYFYQWRINMPDCTVEDTADNFLDAYSMREHSENFWDEW